MDKPGRPMSDESGERLMECMRALRKLHDVLIKEEGGNTPAAFFHAIRIYMVAVAGYFARSELRGTDEETRVVLHDLLDLGIDDFQFNERRHIGSKEVS